MKINNLSDLKKLAKDGEKTLNLEKPRLIFGLSTCGIASGGLNLKEFAVDYLRKKKFEADISSVGCIGMCHAEPLVDLKMPGRPRVTYKDMTEEMLARVIDEHLIGGEPVKELALAQLASEMSILEHGALKQEERYPGIPGYDELPFFSKQIRIILRNCGIINPEDMSEYAARGGYLAAMKALTEMTPDEVIEEVKASGVRGRGGAGFPTGLKWQFARNAMGDQKYLICNADEGDPGAYANRAVLEGDPHSLIEGMVIAGYAIGCSEGYIYVRTEYPLAIERLKIAMKQAEDAGFLGDNIAGSDFCFKIFIREGAGVFVCGEETALIASIEGKRGEPRPRPPFPATKGLWGKPTNINNVETLSDIPVIIEKGGKWFASLGTEKSKGTKVFSLVGKINRTGLIEVPMGIKMRDVIYDIGGGIQGGRKFKAVQTGGPSGGCIPTGHLDIEVDYENLKSLGSIVGSGGMVVLDEDTCMVDIARYFLGFTSEESCGKCTPCRIGTRRMLYILERICRGDGTEKDLETLEHLSVQVKDSALCALGGTAPNPVITTMKYFRDEYEEHVRKKKCKASVCAALFPAPCQNTCPADTNIPGYIQLIKDGRYGEAYELNREDNPFPSICGRVCEHPCESRCQRVQLDEPLAIRELKRFCSDQVASGKGGERPKVTRLKQMKQKVAVVGGGPSGLSAAYFLARLGYHVTLYEAADKLGGMLRYGIPQYRLPHEVIDREIADIVDLGVEIIANSALGKDLKLSQLRDEYDAVYLAIGAQKDTMLGLDGEDLPGVLQGLKLLREINSGKDAGLGKELLVIGGGNVAIDVARSAFRLGCKVTVCYRREEQDMPAYREEIDAAKHEGIEFHFLVAPERIIKKDGRAVGVSFRKMKIGDYTNEGRRRPMPTEEFVDVKADTIVTAIGQRLDREFAGEFGELITERNLVCANADTMATPMMKIFAGGDAVSGPASVIEAIAQGKQAARSIDIYLSGEDRFNKLKAARKIGYSMEEPKGNEARMDRERPTEMGVKERADNFDEVVNCLDKTCAEREAGRCLRCDLAQEEVE